MALLEGWAAGVLGSRTPSREDRKRLPEAWDGSTLPDPAALRWRGLARAGGVCYESSMSYRNAYTLVLAGAMMSVALPAAAETHLPPSPPAADSPPPPAGPIAQPVPMQRQNRGALAGGIVAVSVGGGLLLAGAITGLTQAVCIDCGRAPAPAIGLAVGGLVGLAVGIPLIVYGAKKVPAGAALSSPLPAWAGAPGGRGWVWRF